MPWKKNLYSRTSLGVRCLRLHASNTGSTGLLPRQGTKIPHASQPKDFFLKKNSYPYYSSGEQINEAGAGGDSVPRMLEAREMWMKGWVEMRWQRREHLLLLISPSCGFQGNHQHTNIHKKSPTLLIWPLDESPCLRPQESAYLCSHGPWGWIWPTGLNKAVEEETSTVWMLSNFQCLPVKLGCETLVIWGAHPKTMGEAGCRIPHPHTLLKVITWLMLLRATLEREGKHSSSMAMVLLNFAWIF